MYRRIAMFVAAAAMGMLVAATSAQAAGPPVTTLVWSQGGTAITSFDYGMLDAGAGARKPVMFTLTNSGGRSTGTLAPVALTNTSGTAFSITSDGCSGLALGPNGSCQVTVVYAPTTSGDSDGATLTAIGEHASATSITLTGRSGTPQLTLSPGTLTRTDSNGTKHYNYDFGQVASGSGVTMPFTVTNSARATGTSFPLQLAGLLPNTGFTVSSDQTSGQKLGPGKASTFELTFLYPSCAAPTPVGTPLDVTAQDNGTPYISVNYTATCVPSISSVTGTLVNRAFNPQFVSIGSGSSAGTAVVGTLTNVSFNPPASPGFLAGRLHGFSLQIPFSITGISNVTGQVVAATLNCDSSMIRAYSGGYPGSTCSVSNNVLTVTQNFLPSFTFFNWGLGFSKQIGYAYVGSSLPPPAVCCAYVTWGTPTVIGVR